MVVDGHQKRDKSDNAISITYHVQTTIYFLFNKPLSRCEQSGHCNRRGMGELACRKYLSTLRLTRLSEIPFHTPSYSLDHFLEATPIRYPQYSSTDVTLS